MTISRGVLSYSKSIADNFCKQFGPRSGPTKRRAWSRSKLFDTLMVFLKEFFDNKNDFEINQQATKTWKMIPSLQSVSASLEASEFQQQSDERQNSHITGNSGLAILYIELIL